MNHIHALLQPYLERLDEPRWHEAIMTAGIIIIALLTIHGGIASMNLLIKPRSLAVAALGVGELSLAAGGAWALWRYDQHYAHLCSSIFARAKRR